MPASFLVAHSVLESRHQGEDSLAYLVQVSTVCFKQIGNTENVELGYIQVIEENLICITSPVTRLSVLDVQNPTFFRSVQESCFPRGQYN